MATSNTVGETVSHTSTSSGQAEADPLLVVRDAWKIFGQNTDAAMAEAKKGKTRAEIQADTGCTVGVRDVSFSVQPGETFVIMGLSGSGKSTLLRGVAALSKLTAGSVVLEGNDLTTMSDADLRQVRRQKLAMVFQHFGLFPNRRVIDNVAYGLEVQGIDKKTRYERADKSLTTVGLDGWGNHYPQQLSGGMQQRVGLARALVVDPTLMFFDEPFSALDPLIRREMQDELLRLQRNDTRTIVFVTHDFDEAIRLGDRIAIMKDGQFEQVGTAEEIVADPATDYVREFTQDIARAKVITAASVMVPDSAADGATARRHVDSDALVADVVPLLVASSDPVGVLDASGNALGVIDRGAVGRVVAVHERP